MPASPKLNWNTCKWRLAKLWLGSGAFIFLILLIMSFGNQFKGSMTDLADAWGWFLTTLMPSLSLIVGVLVSDATKAPDKHSRNASTAHYRLAFGLSAFYLIVLALTLMVMGLPFGPDIKVIQMLRMSNFWLAPLQGLASAALGIFYMRAQPPE